MITLMNMRTGDSITLDYNGPYLLRNVDWGEIASTINTSKFHNQIGETINSVRWGTRVVTIDGSIMADAYSTLPQKRRYMEKMFNLNDDIYIEVNDRWLIGKPRMTVRWGKEEETNNEFWCNFSVELFCANPLFRSTVMQQYNLSNWENNLEFPLEITDEGLEFEIVGENEIQLITVKGDIDTSIVLRLKARGDVLNPQFLNIATEELIKINFPMIVGDEIVVNTERNKQSIRLIRDSVEYNIFVYRDKTSKLDMQLKVGQNSVLIGAQFGSINLGSTLEFYDKYLGAEWQC
jgi:hypothetical protein